MPQDTVHVHSTGQWFCRIKKIYIKQSKVASHPSLHWKLICGQCSKVCLKLDRFIFTSESMVEIILHTPGSVSVLSFVGHSSSSISVFIVSKCSWSHVTLRSVGHVTLSSHTDFEKAETQVSRPHGSYSAECFCLFSSSTVWHTRKLCFLNIRQRALMLSAGTYVGCSDMPVLISEPECLFQSFRPFCLHHEHLEFL